MMARRRNPFATILAHEWRDDGTPSKSNDETAAAEEFNSEAIHSDWLDFLVIDAAGQGEAIGAWAVQTLLPKLRKHNPDAAKTTAITHKLISVTGAPAHVLFYETNQTGLANDAAASRSDAPTTILQAPILADMPEAALLCYRSGKRIWPI
jgi:hypothetical protein